MALGDAAPNLHWLALVTALVTALAGRKLTAGSKVLRPKPVR